MPVPTPNAGESREDFMGRCVSFLTGEGKPQDQAVAICASQWGKDINPFPRNEDEKAMFWKAFDSRRWGFLGWAQSRFRRALLEQSQPVIDAIRRTNSISSGLGTIESVSIRPIEDAFMDVYGKVGARFASHIYSSFKSFGVSMQTKQEERSFERFMREWIRTYGAMRFQSISSTTRSRLRTELERAIEEGLGIEETVRRIFGGHIVGKKRARVIARTEIISASNRGSLHGAQQTNLNLGKEWISSRDVRTRRIPEGDRADHLVVDGQRVPSVDKPFKVPTIMGLEELMFPGDPNGSAANVIQCRCTLGYIPEGEDVPPVDTQQVIADVERMRERQRNRTRKRTIIRSRLDATQEQDIRKWLNSVRNERLETYEERERRLLDNWVRGSNRKVSQELEEAAIREFDLKGVRYSSWDPNLDDRLISQTQKDLRNMYQKTQDYYRKRGINRITLYRGVKSNVNNPGAATSWTTDRSIAESFDGHGVIEKEVPIEQVLVSHEVPGWINGPYGNQREFIVLQ